MKSLSVTAPCTAANHWKYTALPLCPASLKLLFCRRKGTDASGWPGFPQVRYSQYHHNPHLKVAGLLSTPCGTLIHHYLGPNERRPTSLNWTWSFQPVTITGPMCKAVDSVAKNLHCGSKYHWRSIESRWSGSACTWPPAFPAPPTLLDKCQWWLMWWCWREIN